MKPGVYRINLRPVTRAIQAWLHDEPWLRPQLQLEITGRIDPKCAGELAAANMATIKVAG